MILDYSQFQNLGLLPNFNGWYFLYELCDPDTFEIRYVGKTKNLKERYRAHTNSYFLKDGSHKSNWINILLRNGKKPLMRVIVLSKSEESIYEQEYLKIIEYKNLGYKLTNIKNGGRGKYPETQELKEKIKNGISQSTKTRKPCSVETKKKIGDSQRGKKRKPISEEQKIKASIPVIGKNILTNEIFHFYGATAAANFLKINASHIMRCCKGFQKSSGGYTWRYV